MRFRPALKNFVDWILTQFANKKAKARKGYIEFVTEGSDSLSPPLEKLSGQTAYGSVRFLEKLQEYLRPEAQTSEIPKSC